MLAPQACEAGWKGIGSRPGKRLAVSAVLRDPAFPEVRLLIGAM
jgi:hypothetical protein